MTEPKNTIFRERSLGGLSTPERLDQLLRIVRPQSWIVTLAVGLGLVSSGFWAYYGRIPVTAAGTAILVRPKQVVGFQSPAAGPIASLEVEVGQNVKEGDLLASVRLPVLENELKQELAKLELFNVQTDELSDNERRQAEQERESIRSQRGIIEERIAHLETTSELYRNENESYIAEQRETVSAALTLSKELGEALVERFDRREVLAIEGINSKDELVEPRSDVIDNKLRQAELDVKAKELDLQEIFAKEKYDAQLDLIQSLQLKLGDLGLREMEITHKLRRDEIASTSERESIIRRIGELETQLDNDSRVLSAHTGRILEITTGVGQHVTLGQRLGKMEIEDQSAELMTIAYFQIKDGKKIKEGLDIRITPSTVERERFGGMRGKVTRVSDYPVTTDGAANQIGDLETARTLLGGATRIEVIASLVPNPEPDPDGTHPYAWTSGTGPDNVPITAGTTAEVRVTIEEIRPIMLVFPFLKSLFGA